MCTDNLNTPAAPRLCGLAECSLWSCTDAMAGGLTGSDAGTYAAGILLSCVISSLNSAGMGLQKRTHRLVAGGGDGAALKYWQYAQWQVGLACLAAGAVGSLGNYALLGQSRASAMASLTIVTNAVMSVFFLGEKFTRIDAAVSVTVGAGIVLAVTFGSAAGGAERNSLDDLLAVLSRDAVYVAAGVTAAVLALSELAVRRLARQPAERRTHASEKAELFLRAFMAGVFSGSTGFFAKASIACIESMGSTRSAADFGRWQFWLFLVGLPASVVLQLRSLNGSLRRFDALAVVPIYQGCIVCVAVGVGSAHGAAVGW